MADFWQNPNLEPKRSYKFILSIPGSSIALPKFLVKKVKKPSFSISETEHNYLNHTFHFPGKVKWEEVSFTIADVIGPDDGAATLMKMFREMGYDLPSATNFETISKSKSTAALGGVIIDQIDSDGNIVESWKLNNAFIKAVSFGELSYESEEMINVDVTLAYDNASYKSGRGAIQDGNLGNISR